MPVALGACAILDQLVPRDVRDDAPLVTIETRGGLCADGECHGVTVIRVDGSVALGGGGVARMPEAVVGPLRAVIAATDFRGLRAVPFEGVCPVAFDGIETVYTFETAHGPERLASCETAMDPEHPLFRAIAAVLEADPIAVP
ncbi:MAG: hypothetical protein V2B17_02550 [Chloroflexota bacterium]